MKPPEIASSGCQFTEAPPRANIGIQVMTAIAMSEKVYVLMNSSLFKETRFEFTYKPK